MAKKRNQTKNILVHPSMTGTKQMSLKELDRLYKSEGALGVGSHYIVDRLGDVLKGRPRDEHGNVLPDFNKNSIFIEVLCDGPDTILEEQKRAVDGIVSYLQDIYDNVEELNHIV